MEDNPRDFGSPGGGGSSGKLVSEQVQQGGQQVVEKAQDAASQAAGQAQERATSMLEGQKGQVATNLTTVAQALRQTSKQLREQDQGSVSQIPDRAADQLERVSGYLQQRNVNELVGELENFARRNSTIFLTGAFAIGALAARFLKSSAQAGASFRQGMGSSRMAQGPYQYGNLPYSRDTIGETPRVEMGYAPGLMGHQTPGQGYGTTGTEFGTGTETPYRGTETDLEHTDAIEPADSWLRSSDLPSGSGSRHDDGTTS